ncbi:MAG: SRPBCC domain-containing protein [Actinomycetota bacterium]
MTRYHVEQHIDAPADAAWALLTDAATWKDWNPTIVSIDGPIAVGRKVALVSTLNPKRTFKLNVDELTDSGAAGKRMVWSDGMPLGLFTGTRTYTVGEREGGCTFTMTEEYTGLMAPLITRSIPDMTDSFKEFAVGLKAGAEQKG